MTPKELKTEVQRVGGLDKATCALLLSGLERVFQEEIIHMTTISLSGLGSFVPHKHPEYLQDDPASGQVLLYPPRITCRFQPVGESADESAAANSLSGGGLTIDAARLAALLSDYVKLSIEAAEAFVQALVQVTTTHLHAGEEVTWAGFGTFRIVNFRDGESRRVAWVIDHKMREQINAPFSCFEPVPVGQMEPQPQPDDASRVEPQPETSTEAEIEIVAEPDASAEPGAKTLAEPEVAAVADNVADASVQTEIEVPKPSETDALVPIATENDRATTQKASEIHTKTRKTVRKWIFGGIIFLFLLLIFNICAKLFRSATPATEAPIASICDTSSVEESCAEASDVAGLEASEDDSLLTDEAAMQDSTAMAETAEPEPMEAQPAESEVAKEESAPMAEAPATQNNEAGYLHDAQGKRLTEKVQPGDRLTLMARRLYGHKAFWVYLYEVNRDKLSSPNNVTAGMELYLPNPTFWKIDSTSERSVQSALRRAAELVK